MNWRNVQQRLGVTADGLPGPVTFGAVFRHFGATDAAAELGASAARHFPSYGLTNALRLAHWFGQMAHECGHFQRFEENLNYSADRLTRVWPARFPTLKSAEPFARNPRALANKVYGGRMGNVRDGDGWKYRGRGCIHLTGAEQYLAAQIRLGIPLYDEPDRAADPATAVLIACDYWKHRGVERAADADNLVLATKLINGGSHGIQERRTLTLKGKALFA